MSMLLTLLSPMALFNLQQQPRQQHLPILGMQPCPLNSSTLPPFTLPPVACARPNMLKTDICAHNQRAPKLTPELVKGAAVHFNRHEGLRATVPRGGRIVEVGTMNGALAKWIMTTLQPVEFVVIDIDPKAIQKCNKHFAHTGKVSCRLGASAEILASLPDDHYDMIYIDGDHGYNGVCADMEAARAKVKPGGLMVMNDYYAFESQFLANPLAGAKKPRFAVYGVIFSTNEFALRHRWPMAYLAMHHLNFPDVALRRPSR